MVEESKYVLIYAVRPRVMSKYGGQLALMLAALTLPPLGVAAAYADWTSVMRYAVLCGALTLGGAFLARLPAPTRIQSNEALVLTALVFVLAPVLMTWPIISGDVPWLDALFEAVSGITTTGLSTLGSIEGRPASLLFARAWLQWYGGLGIIVLSVALLMGHHAAARRLANPVETGETFAATARAHARRGLIVYLWLTLLGVGLVWALTGNGFEALLHVLSAVSTGGFSSHDRSLAGMTSGAAPFAVMALALLGAVSLPLYWRVFHAGWAGGLRALVTDVEARALLLGCLLVGGLLSWLGWLHGVQQPWYNGFMTGISAQTTAGFATQPVADLDPASKLITIASMLVGASVGSSGGGFKLLRLLILIRVLQLALHRIGLPPHAVAEPYLAGQKLDPDDITQALQLMLLFIGVAVLSWLPFLLLGYDPLDALFEVASACGTVGLSTGISRPQLEPLLKAVLCFDMLAGRVEIIALLAVLYPRSWFGRRGVDA